MGWRIQRVWSTDWFRNPDREIAELAKAIEGRASAPPRADEPTAPPSTPERETPVAREAKTTVAEVAAAPASPYLLARPTPFGASIELHEVLTATLAARVVEVVIVEGPVHVSEVMRRIAEAVGVRRIGTPIEAALRAASERAVRQGKLRQAGEFLSAARHEPRAARPQQPRPRRVGSNWWPPRNWRWRSSAWSAAPTASPRRTSRPSPAACSASSARPTRCVPASCQSSPNSSSRVGWPVEQADRRRRARRVP